MSLNANALVTLADAKSELDISANTEDSRVEGFINAASAAIEAACTRKLKQATYTDYFDGSGHAYLKGYEFPITSITSANMDDAWTFGVGTDIPTSGLKVLRDIYVVRRAAFWSAKAPLNIKLVYVAGYATVPNDLQQACLELVKLLYHGRNERRTGIAAKSKLGENVSYQTDKLPPLIESLINPYKRAVYLANQMEGITLGGV